MSNLQIIEFEQQAQLVLKEAENIIIFNDDDYKAACDFAVKCQNAIKSIDKAREEARKPLREQMDMIQAKAKQVSEPFEKAKGIAQMAMHSYVEMQKKRQQEAERKAREEAEKERKRLEEEAKKIEEAVEVKENATFGEKIMAQAETQRIRSEIQKVGTVVEVVSVPKKTAAMVVKKSYVAEIISPEALIEFIAKKYKENSIFLGFVKFDMGKINKFINAAGPDYKIDGVDFKIKETITTRASRAK